MANSRTAIKRIKINEKKRSNAIAQKSALRSTIKRYLHSLEGDQANAQENLQKAVKALDKAAAKGLIHKNAANRRKSRLVKKMAN